MADGAARCPSCRTPLRSETGGTNPNAVASLVFGILWMFGLGAVLALVFGSLAKAQIAEDPSQGGDGLATAGMVLGMVGLTLNLVLFVIFFG